MTNLLNTLYVTTAGARLKKDHESVAVRVGGRTALSVPMHHLAGIVCLGKVSVSPVLMNACAGAGIAISFFSISGRFLARVDSPRSGNVLLRRAQYRLADDPSVATTLSRSFVAGKIANARALLQRAAREQQGSENARAMDPAIDALERSLAALARAGTVDQVRGHEGEAAATYFGVFDRMLRRNREHFLLEKRTRRPPLDGMNALLSFLYALLVSDTAAALQGTGLDPQVGFLHADRPARPSLALDLAEEFRPALADRLAVAVVNLGQVTPEGFVRSESGAVSMDDATRREVIIAYQKRKQEELLHPFTGEKVTLALAIHLQARLLARALRGEMAEYPPFVTR